VEATGLRRVSLLLLLALVPWLTACSDSPANQVSTPPLTHGPVRGEVVLSGLEHPWSLAFLPDGDMLITERSGRLRHYRPGGGQTTGVDGLPPIATGGQAGLLDVALHPDFATNRLVYLSYVAEGPGGRGTEVARARLVGDRLEGLEVIFRLSPKSDARHHFGSRLLFDRGGHLFITLGDGGGRERAQDLGDHAGSIVRLNDDGSVPADNPFVDTPGARPEIYSYGHRNIQGAALHPQSGALWIHEHGPHGGDEVNLIQVGGNYGWPVTSYGSEYATHLPVGEVRREGMLQPLYYWVPSIAPSGMTFYTGERYPGWQGSLFVGALKSRMLVRLALDGDRILAEERLLEQQFGRVRDVRQGPDGYLYLLIDAPAPNGQLVRLLPTPAATE